MKQEFVTVKGKIAIERNVLFIRNLDRQFHHSLLYELAIPIFWIIAATLKFLDAENNFDYFGGGVFAVLAIFHSYPLYDVLFRRSMSTRIPVHKIKNYETKETASGLETDVILHLSSGRYKKIPFRTREGEYENFVNWLAQHITQPQLS